MEAGSSRANNYAARLDRCRMGDATNQRTRSLEAASPALFLAAGGLITVHAGLRGVEAFTSIAAPPDVFGPIGYLLAIIGLFGLYPALVTRNSVLARVAAAVAVVPLVGWVVITTSTVGRAVGLLPPQAAVLPGVFYAVHLGSVMLTYGLFGAVSLRADARPRVFGALLLGAPALFVVMIAGAAVLGNSAAGSFAVGGGLALLHLAAGSVLRADVRTARDASTGDPTPGS